MANSDAKEANITIPFDLTNLCHFSACCGLLEPADAFWPGEDRSFDQRHLRDWPRHADLPACAVAPQQACSARVSDPAATSDRRSPAAWETCGPGLWLGQSPHTAPRPADVATCFGLSETAAVSLPLPSRPAPTISPISYHNQLLPLSALPPSANLQTIAADPAVNIVPVPRS